MNDFGIYIILYLAAFKFERIFILRKISKLLVLEISVSFTYILPTIEIHATGKIKS